MIQINAQDLSQLLLTLAARRGGVLQLKWEAGVEDGPLRQTPEPAELQVRAGGPAILASIRCLEDGLNTVLQAVNAADQQMKPWQTLTVQQQDNRLVLIDVS